MEMLGTDVPKHHKDHDALVHAAQLIRRGNKKQAKKTLDAVLAGNPRSSSGWFLSAFVTDDRAKKIEALERAVALNPRHVEARRRLAALRVEGAEDASGALPFNADFADATQPGETTLITPIPGRSRTPMILAAIVIIFIVILFAVLILTLTPGGTTLLSSFNALAR